MSQKNRSRQRSKKLACILCAVCVLGCLLLAGCQEKAEDPAPGGVVYDDAAVEGGWETLSEEEIVASLNEKVEEGYINISMNASPVFEDGQAEGSLMIVNEEVNRYPPAGGHHPGRHRGDHLHLRRHPPWAARSPAGRPGCGPARRGLRVYRHVP